MLVHAQLYAAIGRFAQFVFFPYRQPFGHILSFIAGGCELSHLTKHALNYFKHILNFKKKIL